MALCQYCFHYSYSPWNETLNKIAHKFWLPYMNINLNPLCKCDKDIESTMHFFLHCTNVFVPRENLFQKIRNSDDRILSRSKTQLNQTLRHGNQNYNSGISKVIIISTIEYLIFTERFKCSLFENSF